MTLCIAAKIGDTITFAADSRLTFGDNGHVDFAVKVLRVPVVVTSALGPSGSPQEIYKHDLGLCIVGNAINSYLVKETVSEVLQHLQYYDFQPTFSLEVLCNYVKKIYEKFSLDLGQVLNNWKAVLIIGGYCPQTERDRAFVFDFATDYCREVPSFATMTEILTDNDIKFYGSGAEKAEELYACGTTDPYHILKAVIDDQGVPGVGGAIQSGRFEGGNFKMKVIEEYLLSGLGLFSFRHALRGINLYQKELGESTGFKVDYELLFPFRREAIPVTTGIPGNHWPAFVREDHQG
ncbi:hypothetical protein L4X63_23385 [Geomonas sp. Red32]|uniref:hypothetical protein n=1 Tax=Geomonas sp. Red32 TaxID=2912856 RepID=UPI00202CEAEB|nr:hypothetical protein [Geomonas sp. Red32]MCM0084523.1 hypothetical protein [Geomonas sp. Red32]